MKSDDIERILASEPAISPSPQFLAAVMRAVEQEAAARPPLAFPWRRALPGLIALVVAIAATVHQAAGLLVDPAAGAAFAAPLARIAGVAVHLQLHWIALAAMATLVAAGLSSRLVRGGVPG
jgi:hypothetical protein